MIIVVTLQGMYIMSKLTNYIQNVHTVQIDYAK